MSGRGEGQGGDRGEGQGGGGIPYSLKTGGMGKGGEDSVVSPWCTASFGLH